MQTQSVISNTSSTDENTSDKKSKLCCTLPECGITLIDCSQIGEREKKILLNMTLAIFIFLSCAAMYILLLSIYLDNKGFSEFTCATINGTKLVLKENHTDDPIICQSNDFIYTDPRVCFVKVEQYDTYNVCHIKDNATIISPALPIIFGLIAIVSFGAMLYIGFKSIIDLDTSIGQNSEV